MTRLLITADLHYNHPRSAPLAEALIDRMNDAGGDVLLLVGDTAAAEGDALERCLSRFRFKGPRLFVAGNHELWTRGSDSAEVFRNSLPARVRSLGWHWLETQPFVSSDSTFAVVGSVGWYDYAFAVAELGIPRRFYEHKVSPGAAARVEGLPHSVDPLAEDVPSHAREIVARWNDGKFVKLHQRDEDFLDERLSALQGSLEAVRAVPIVVGAVHHVPFAELLPPRRGAQWDFARAYLGSPRIGRLLLSYSNVRHVYCGHSHFPIEAGIDHLRAVNVGSGYRAKTFQSLDLP